MAKYSFEFKLKAVRAYLNNEGGYSSLSGKYNIPDTKTLRCWVAAYKAFGNEGLFRSRKNQAYTYDFKLYVVELYLTTEISYQELALHVGINTPSILCRWINDYRAAGPEALKPKRKGRAPAMSKINKSNKSKPVKETEVSADAEYLKQLEEENLKLRIENAYLKELRRLRLEEKSPKKKRE